MYPHTELLILQMVTTDEDSNLYGPVTIVTPD